MNIRYFAILSTVVSAFLLCGAEPVLKNGVLSFGGGVKLVPYTQTVKWISPEERAAKNRMTEKDVWETVLPGKTAPVVIATSLKAQQDNTFAYSAAWKFQDKKDVKERFLFLNLPLDSVKGKNFVFNGKTVPVVGIRKFAWYQLRNQVISMTFFKDEAGKEFTLTSKGKIRVSCETHPKGNLVWVRIYPVNPVEQIEFTVSVK